MKRRGFLKLTTIGTTGLLFGSVLIEGCSYSAVDEEKMLEFAPLSKDVVSVYLSKDNQLKSLYNDEVFKSNRTIILSDSYEIIDSKIDKRGMPVDYILRVDVEAFIHYNYDIFCEETLVKSVYEKENGLIYIYPAGMNRIINYVPIFQTIDFPVKRDMKLAGKVHDYYKLPRVMSKDIFLASVKCGRIDEYVK